MVFSSPFFLFAFLPAVLFLHWVLGKRFRNTVLLAASLFFYFWGEHVYVLLILASIFFNHVFASALERLRLREGSKKSLNALLAAAVVFNLGLLFFFKYFNFFAANLNAALSGLGLPLLPPPAVYLPLGISFYTFQAMSLVIDVRRGVTRAPEGPAKTALFIALFPQLIAGPILRYSEIEEQLDRRTITLERYASGARRFIAGLAKKVLIADSAGRAADYIFAIPPEFLPAGIAWIGIACFTLQLYFDFSGYTDMAIGLGRLFGFDFPENFNYPYTAQSIRDFWRRWHMTLIRWLRDYLYLPLGGSRVPLFRAYVNIFLVFVLCGLWHGAGWNYILWGAFNGCFLMLERAGLQGVLNRLWRPFRHLYLMAVVMAGFVIFRSESLAYAAAFFRSLAGFSPHPDPNYFPAVFVHSEVVLAFLLGVPWSLPLAAFFGEKLKPYAAKASGFLLPRLGAAFLEFAGLTLLLFASACAAAGSSYHPFIYFNF